MLNLSRCCNHNYSRFIALLYYQIYCSLAFEHTRVGLFYLMGETSKCCTPVLLPYSLALCALMLKVWSLLLIKSLRILFCFCSDLHWRYTSLFTSDSLSRFPHFFLILIDICQSECRFQNQDLSPLTSRDAFTYSHNFNYIWPRSSSLIEKETWNLEFLLQPLILSYIMVALSFTSVQRIGRYDV